MHRIDNIPDRNTASVRQFQQDVLEGLTATPKRLNSKYFYDAHGDILFQKIMQAAEYYLTSCEMEILTEQSTRIATTIREYAPIYEVVGLGTGDASKAVHLLQEFMEQAMIYRFLPIDISPHIIHTLQQNLPTQVPRIQIKGYSGEYLAMLDLIKSTTSHPKIVLFLGSSIGNYKLDEALFFCKELNKRLNKGDMLFIGFDLKKHPQTILNAYNDKQNYTKKFNLNLLTRINRELGGNFKIDQFDHFPTYNPETGACESFLISLREQNIHVADKEIYFYKNEAVHTEISQKFSVEQTDELARKSGFTVVDKFYDTRQWFMDSLWIKG